jgi:cytosine/adenosine deaminase-related metal-dependent hydrolase
MPIEKLTAHAREALEWATINNARALRMEHRIGSLTPGKQADIILLRAEDINMIPAMYPIQAAVFHANSSNVDTVFVNGNKVKARGELLYSPDDLKRKKQQLMESGRRIIQRGGFTDIRSIERSDPA